MRHSADVANHSLADAPNMALRRNPALQQGCAVFAKDKKRVYASYRQALGVAVAEP